MSVPLTSNVDYEETLYFQVRAAAAGGNTSVVPSTATFGSNTNSFVDSRGNTRTFYSNHSGVPLLASAADSFELNHAGNDTAFNANFALIPRRAFRLSQVFLNFAAAMNVSAYTNGNPLLGNLQCSVYQWSAGSLIPIVGVNPPLNFATGFSALASAVAQIYIVRLNLPLSGVNISENDQLVVNVTTAATTSGTNTRQEGVMPIFPLNLTATTKTCSMSCAIFRGTALEP